MKVRNPKYAGHVAALKEVRESTRTGRTRYICLALWRTSERDASTDLRYLISERLEGEGTLENWLHTKGFLSRDQRRQLSQGGPLSADLRRKLKVTRLAWIDSLIKEFSEKK